MVGLLAFAQPASAREGWRGWCEQGNNSVVTSGISSTNKVQLSFPRCQVLVTIQGAGLATIYADNNGTPLANPFQANLDGSWIFYANDGRYSVSTTRPDGLTFTYLDVLLCDPFVPGAACAGASAGTVHNLLSTTHLDTIPASPPVRGDVITSQNQTSPTGVTPAWARLPLGSAGQVLLSNGIDALWGTLTAGSNITITNTGSPPGSTVTIAASGASLCTASTAGTWDVNPQTCAGEKTIQGFAGNATTKNFTILPASDETVTNLYAGDPFASFSNISAFSFFSDNPLTNSFNVGSVFNRTNASSPIAAGLLGYNQDNSSSSNPLFGVRCVGYESGTQAGTVQACEGEAYFSGTGVVPIMDAFSSFAQMSGTGTVDFMTGFYSSANKNTSGATSHVHNNYGFFSENQAGVGLNNYEIFLITGVGGTPAFFVNSDTGHVNIPAFETARLKHICFSTTSLDTNATDVLSTCLQDTPGVFSTIGTCNSGNEGGLAAVTDSTTNVWGATITGTGANHVLAYCDGTNWTVSAK